MLQKSTSKLKVSATAFVPSEPYWICPEEDEFRWNYQVLKAGMDESFDHLSMDDLQDIQETESISTLASLFTQSSKDSGRIDLSTAERRLEQRQKQIDYGKVFRLIEYRRISTIPRCSAKIK